MSASHKIRCRGGRRRTRRGHRRDRTGTWRPFGRCCSTAPAASSRAAARSHRGLSATFAIPDHLLVARVTAARMIAPSARAVDMPIDGGFVGMVDREVFDEFLRDARRRSRRGPARPAVRAISRDQDGTAVVHYQPSARRPPRNRFAPGSSLAPTARKSRGRPAIVPGAEQIPSSSPTTKSSARRRPGA